MVYKAIGDKGQLPFGGPVVHCVATSDSPTGPFEKHPNPIFVKEGVHFAAEDPFIWFDSQCFWAIVKDQAGNFTGKGKSLALFQSDNGFDWSPAKNLFVTTADIPWAEKQEHKLVHLERPQLYQENGSPVALLCAAMDVNANTFNVQIPLSIMPGSAEPVGEGSNENIPQRHAADVDSTRRLPSSECNLRLEAPVKHWSEAIPLGNGQLGALLWGHDNQLVVKLDRLDIWDERCNPIWRKPEFTWKNIQDCHAADNLDRIYQLYDGLCKDRPPTHIALGKLLLTLPQASRATLFELDLAQAEARVGFQDGSTVTAFASATEPVIILRLPRQPERFDLWAPGIEPQWPAALGYPEPVFGHDQEAQWYQQTIPETGDVYGYDGTHRIPEWSFVVYAQCHRIADETLVAVTITSSLKDGPDPLAAARIRTHKALGIGYDHLLTAHRGYWTRFWETSAVYIPDAEMLQHYYLTRYFLGASSRPGFPAMSAIMSVWTDDKILPTFKNDLHNDLETQVQYQSYQTSGNFAEGRVLFDYLWDLLPVFRGYAKSFFESEGAAVPGVMTLGGHPCTGWPQYGNSPTFAGWLGWLFYQHWRYTQDREFLESRAYPWCVAIAECWGGLLREDDQGILKLPLSSSAEIFNNSPRSWLQPNSNQDLDLMQTHLLGLAEMADVLNRNEDAKRWREMGGKLGRHHVDDAGALMWSANEPVQQSHRHFSHMMGIWPFNLLTVDGSDHDRQVIAATLKRFDELGTDAWFGFSWTWMSSIQSRVGDGEAARRHLDVFLKGFTTRNGFHMNFDINNVLGARRVTNAADAACIPFSTEGYFTIEANIMANQAIQDMLIQSWAPSIGHGEAGITRLFPAMPWDWHEASFTDLRAEGGFRVSARREKNATIWFKISADSDGLFRLHDNFGGRIPQWIGAEMTKIGRNFERTMCQGDVIEATLETPSALPPRKGVGPAY
jgi:alpha-L-fucosidase 2